MCTHKSRNPLTATSTPNAQFVSHLRTEENFVRGNLDPLREMPPAYPPERAPCIYHKKLLRKVLFFQPHIQEAMIASLDVAFFAGALGALTWLIKMATGDGDSVNLDSFNAIQAEAAVALIMASEFVDGILDNFQFFPAFLLLGLLTFIVNRYKRLMQTCRHRRTLLTRGRPRCLQMARIPDQLSHCSGAPSRHTGVRRPGDFGGVGYQAPIT